MNLVFATSQKMLFKTISASVVEVEVDVGSARRTSTWSASPTASNFPMARA
jgi:hypothetical protein